MREDRGLRPEVVSASSSHTAAIARTISSNGIMW